MSYINRNFPGYAKDKKDGRHKRRSWTRRGQALVCPEKTNLI